MQLFRHQLRVFTWIALFAIGALALAPSVSRALDANTAANPWAQICSTPGGSGSPALPGTLAHAEHCPLCGQAAGPLGLPPAAVAVRVAPVQRGAAAPSVGAVAVQTAVWGSAKPRGPPLFS